MKVPLKWLKDYVDIDLPAEELASRLTTAGLEVSNIQVIGGSWDNVVVGRIAGVNPHPNADRLRLATVDLGGKQMTVVCGAPNLNVGDNIAFAFVGARLIDGHTDQLTELKPAKIRGVASEGMVCSEKELGISDEHQGILVLPPEYEVGRPLAEYLGDVVFDINITPNRADCLSVMGIAREVAALTGKKFRMPDLSYPEMKKTAASLAEVEIKAPDLCPRYCATVIEGIKIAPSPRWMQDRLTACGMRPINNVVDITNYVMLEMGQPLHAFDYQEIRGHKIIVRRADDGEIMYTLDDQERKFNRDTLLIADADRAVAVAGIMGGLSSEVVNSTTTILLESANFSEAVIHRGSQLLKLSSEASARFEKGLNPDLALMASKRATQLIAELGGGKAAKGIIDAYPGQPERKPVSIRSRDVTRLLGVELDLDAILRSLQALGLDCLKDSSAGSVLVQKPWWRNDINCTADLVEEVARVTGYDNIPTTILSSALPSGGGSALVPFRQEVRELLVACGFQEIISYPLTSVENLQKLYPDASSTGLEPLKIANPMSRDLEFLRTNMRMGVLSVLSRNQRNRETNIRLFEMGKIYLPRKRDLPQEKELICGLIDSVVPETYWQGKASSADFYTAKGVVEAILSRYGIQAQFTDCADGGLNPAKSADITAGDDRIGVVGEVHPRIIANFDITDPAYLFEIDLARLLSLASAQKVYKSASKYPSMVRDVALILDSDITFGNVADIIRNFQLVSDVFLFDMYAGEQIPAGKKSMAFRITYQADDRTLNDREVDGVTEGILTKLARETGAKLRS
jgi:phenylalanyl-tRNA synthetase beta chain